MNDSDVVNADYNNIHIDIFAAQSEEKETKPFTKPFGSTSPIRNAFNNMSVHEGIGSKFQSMLSLASSVSQSDLEDQGKPANYTIPPSPGKLVAKMNLSLPSTQTIPKFSETYILSTNGKESGKMELKLGFYKECCKKYTTHVTHQDFLNLYVRTSSTLVWKKFWVSLKQGVLMVYDFEYQERQPPVGTLRVTDFGNVGTPNQELFSAPNCLRISIQKSFTQTSNLMLKEWRETLIDREESKGHEAVIYIMGDTFESIRNWESAIVASMP